jgi:hypothetical protein
MRRLQPPTLTQWGCAHRWKTTTSRPGDGDILRVRYLTCRRCGLKLKTEERPAVPWDDADFIAQVKALLPEGEPVFLRDRGIPELPLEALNGRLEPRGYRIHADQSWYAAQAVACVNRKGRMTWYAQFELRLLSPNGPGDAINNRRKGR